MQPITFFESRPAQQRRRRQPKGRQVDPAARADIVAWLGEASASSGPSSFFQPPSSWMSSESSTITMTKNGRICGSVMWRMRWETEAPSTEAAS